MRRFFNQFGTGDGASAQTVGACEYEWRWKNHFNIPEILADVLQGNLEVGRMEIILIGTG